MKNLRKSMSVVLILLVSLFCLSTVAFASTPEQDGLKVELTTDKENYSLNEDIKINVTVTNTNDVTVENVKIDTLLPEEFILKDKNKSTSSEAVDIPAGKKIEFSVVAVVKDGKSDKTSSDTDSKLTGTSTNNKGNINKQNDKSPYTGKDYAVMTGFSALFIIGIVLLILCLKRNRKKTSKAVSSALCLVLAITSIIGLADFKAKAENKQSDTDTSSVISISENISVDGKDYTIEANVNYGLLVSDGTFVDKAVLIKDFTLKATPFDILVGEKTDVLFQATCNLPNVKNIKPALYDEDNNFIDYLYDNGEDGDEIANDGIYSASCNLYSNEEKFLNYYVFVNGNLSSNAEEIFFYANFTNEELNEIQNFETELSKIENKYVSTDGYTKEKDISPYLTEACKICNNYKKIILLYDYDEINNSVYIELKSGMTYLITPKIEGRLVGGTSNEIITIAPDQTSFTTAMGQFFLGKNYYSAEDTAKKIKQDFSDKFKYDKHFEDSKVTIETLKNLSSFKLLVWNGHGGYNEKKDIAALMTSTSIPKITSEIVSPYTADIKAGRIIKSASFFSKFSTLGITSKFVDKYFPEGNNSIVYLGACYSLANDSLGKSFVLKGTGAVYGYNKSVAVDAEVEIRTKLFNDLCTFNEQTNNYNSVEEAYYSKLNGSSEYGFTYYISNRALCLIENEKISTGSITGIVKDSTTNNPIKDVQVEVIDNSSDSFDPITTTKTNENGNFNFNLPYGSYSISFNHSDYNYYGTSITIDCENVVLTEPVLLKKVNKKLSKEEIIKKLELHYNSLPNVKGTYSITDVEDTDTELKACLRYSMSNEEAEEIIANGGFPSPNKLVTGLTVDKTTGLVTEDIGGGYWYLWFNRTELINAYSDKINEKWNEIKKENPNEESVINYSPQYMLYDIDNNGIMELIIDMGTYESNRTFEFYTYKNGLINLGTVSGSHSVITVPSDKNGLYLNYSHMDTAHLYRLTLDGGKIKESTIFENKDYEYADKYKSTLLKEYHASDLSELNNKLTN